MKHKTLSILLCICLLAATLLSPAIFGCNGSDEKSDGDYQQVLLEEMNNLGLLMVNVNASDPMIWPEIDPYINGEFQNTAELSECIDIAFATVEDVIRAIEIWPETPSQIAVEEETTCLRSYVLLGAYYVKALIEIIKRDLEAGNNSSIDITDEMSSILFNKYRYYFRLEYKRLCEKYGFEIKEY